MCKLQSSKIRLTRVNTPHLTKATKMLGMTSARGTILDNFLDMHRKRPPVALLAKILSEEKDDQLILDAAYCCKHVLSRLQNHLFINMTY